MRAEQGWDGADNVVASLSAVLTEFEVEHWETSSGIRLDIVWHSESRG